MSGRELIEVCTFNLPIESNEKISAMNILVLKQAEFEHPGVLRKFLNEDGHRHDSIKLQNGEMPIASLYFPRGTY